MAYSTANPPFCIVAGPSGAMSLWGYQSIDAASVVDASGYFTNGAALGMKQGDLIFVTDTDASPVIITSHVVNRTGTTIDLSDGVTLGSTNTD